EAIGVQHLRPEVRPVVRRVTTGEDVVEVGGTVARGDLIRDIDASLLDRVAFEGGDVRNLGGLVLSQLVPGQVHHAGGDVLGGGKALAPLRLLLDGGDQLGGQHLTGIHVLGVVGQNLRLEGPVLVDLGGELHEVARHGGAGQARVAN